MSKHDLISKLVETCEQFYFERCVLESLLKQSKVPDWEAKYNRAMGNSRLRAQNHAIFGPCALRLQHVDDYEESLRELLRTLPPSRQTN